MELRDKNGLTEEEFLKSYQARDYERPSVAADMVIFTVMDKIEKNYRKLPEKELKVLLIHRGGHPYLGCLALPGGFVCPNETIEQAAKRELREETGVENVYLEQLYTFSEPRRDPRMWIMSCSHMALIDSSKVKVQAGDDAQSAAWYTISYKLIKTQQELVDGEFEKKCCYELKLSKEKEEIRAVVEHSYASADTFSGETYHIIEKGGIAFDHAKILACAIERLRGKVEHTGIALHLMQEQFTLTELQKVYEVILDKKLLKAAFRRKISEMVIETNCFIKNGGHRPSRLYRRNPEQMI